ncbi:PAS domain S-box protein [Clostridium thailandense]|uniref:SpoIIE family protein phosphatase n=1 Tax=Clostridium thailandense TaxID=2794346 RepID=UPI0039895227
MEYELKSNELMEKIFFGSSKEIIKLVENDYYTRLLEGVLSGIPDIIRVFNPESKTILFLNEAGYKFYNKTRDEVRNKKCYEILNRQEKCESCDVEKAIKLKHMIKTEKYVSEFNRFMECTCNPILGENGEVALVIEQLKDITEKKILVNTIKESEERYRKIVDLSPEAIVIAVENKIVLVNHQACKLVGIDYSRIIGESIYKYVDKEFLKIMHKRVKHILEEKKTKCVFDYKIVRYDNSSVDVEISSSYLTYKGKPAIQSVIRNITEIKRGLNGAAKFQKKYLNNTSPIPDKFKMDSLFMPARTVSGDFFRICKVNEDLAVGIVGDVSGKGITAALSVSAFFVLFHEAVLLSVDPSDIAYNLNKKIVDYLDDRHIAACCFSLDFRKNKAKVVGAGISQFLFQKNKCKPEEFIIRGPFLGMFEDSVFDEKIIYFEKGDRFYFPTDGLEFIFNDNEIKENCFKAYTIAEFISYLSSILNNTVADIGGLKDDSTIVALEIK